MSRRTTDDELLAELAKRLTRLNLEGIQLVDGRCHRAPGLDLANLPAQAEQNIQLGGGVNKKEKHIDVKASFRISIGRARPEDVAQIELAATFILRYSFVGSGKVSEEGMGAFCRRMGAMAAWPYWREFVQNTITRMGLPPLTIPLLHPTVLSGSGQGSGKLPKGPRKSLPRPRAKPGRPG